MISYAEYIVEAPNELHPQLQKIVDSDADPHIKRNQLAKTIRNLKAAGADPGIEDKMPKGSSRTVLLHKEPTKINIDGQETSMPTITKIAHTHKNQRGSLESFAPRHFEGHESLGTHQNAHETDYFAHQHHSVLREDFDSPGHFKTNEEGILPPMVDKDNKDHTWIQMGHVKNITAPRFRELTKTPEFPKGISHEEFYHATNDEYARSQGRHHYCNIPERHLMKLKNHPLVDKTIDYCGNMGTHPADFVKQNMGEWHNPVTGKSHVVIRDSGATEGLLKVYSEARRNKYAAGRY